MRAITIIGLIIRYCSYYDADLFIAGLQYADLRLQGGPIRYPLVVRVPKSLFWDLTTEWYLIGTILIQGIDFSDPPAGLGSSY